MTLLNNKIMNLISILTKISQIQLSQYDFSSFLWAEPSKHSQYEFYSLQTTHTFNKRFSQFIIGWQEYNENDHNIVEVQQHGVLLSLAF